VILTILSCASLGRRFFRDRLLRACAAFGLAGFLGCFPRPDIAHIAFAAPLVCPLLAYGMERLMRPWRPSYRYAAAMVAVILCAPSAGAFSSAADVALRGEIVTTPRGRVTFPSGHGEGVLLARIAATPSGDAYFFYPHMPMLPFLTGREHVSRYDVFTPLGYTLPSEYREACVSAMRRAAWVVIDRTWTDPVFLKLIFPAMQDTQLQKAKTFELALEHGFDLVSREGTFELRRRIKEGDESICAALGE
jgi:hypothetical protein